jgi:YidC/Oxa1 family membrane protein insertase
MLMASVPADIWNAIVAFLNVILQFFYNLTGNYGIAIIMLTVLIKIILLPLTIKQTRSMVAMQKIQPEVKKLQEKYKDDKEKLSQEMMKFYKENKVNPLSGCLPLILQLPVFFALYTAIRKYLLTPPTLLLGNTMTILPGYLALPIVKSANFLWMENLADSTRIADPYFILVALLAVTTWYSQKQVMSDPRQKSMLYIMPIITAFIGLSLPAGVVLYWLTTNTLQILQQWGIEYWDKKHPKEELKGKAAIKAAEEKAQAKGKAAAAKGKEPTAKGRAAAAKGKTPTAKGKAAAKGKAPPRSKASSRPKSPPQGKKKAAPKDKTPAKSGASKQNKGSQKGKGAAKASGAAKGGKKSQVRRPKGPPPTQKKTQKSTKGRGAQKKK